MEENWKDIKGYEGKYQVSDHGNVRSMNYKGTGKVMLLKPGKNKGYLQVSLSRCGTAKNYTIHRLVADAFIDNPYGFNEVNHRDEDPTNNSVDNLEWCDHSYNMTFGNRTEKQMKTNLMNGNYNNTGFYSGRKEYNRDYAHRNLEKYREYNRRYRLRKRLRKMEENDEKVVPLF